MKMRLCGDGMKGTESGHLIPLGQKGPWDMGRDGTGRYNSFFYPTRHTFFVSRVEKKKKTEPTNRKCVRRFNEKTIRCTSRAIFEITTYGVTSARLYTAILTSIAKNRGDSQFTHYYLLRIATNQIHQIHNSRGK